MLLQRLHSRAGIRIDSTNNVIAGCVAARMAYLGLEDVDSYLAVFDDSINARAEWLALIDLLNARYGIHLVANDVTNLGMSILKTERAFNLAAGFTNKDDRLPEFFSEEPIAPHNVVWDITDEAIDSFWNF